MSPSTSATSSCLPPAAADVFTVTSLQQGMTAIFCFPALPDGARHKIAARSLAAPDAALLLQLLDTRSTAWRVVNRTAIQGLAKAHDILSILAKAVLPFAADSPTPATLDFIRLWEEPLRQCAAQVGGSFEQEAVPLCTDLVHHVRASVNQSESRAWIVRDAKALGKRAAKLSQATHTLSQVDDEDKAADQKKAIGEEGY